MLVDAESNHCRELVEPLALKDEVAVDVMDEAESLVHFKDVAGGGDGADVHCDGRCDVLDEDLISIRWRWSCEYESAAEESLHRRVLLDVDFAELDAEGVSEAESHLQVVA